MEVTCITCLTKFDKTPTEIKRSKSGNHFCSRSCAAKHNNKTPKRKRAIKTCSLCDNPVIGPRRKLCEFHTKEREDKLNGNLPLSHYKNKKSVKGKHPSWTYSHVRSSARTQHKDLLLKPCAKCGYDKHVELCHIKPLSSFSDEVLLKEVNSIDNVIQLCPNCHWEFDNLSRDNFFD